MTNGRRLLLKAAAVVALGTVGMLTAPPTAAAAVDECGFIEGTLCEALTTCETLSCPESCPQLECIYNPGDPCVGGNDVYRAYCGIGA
jgi:hypothetical protein